MGPLTRHGSVKIGDPKKMAAFLLASLQTRCEKGSLKNTQAPSGQDQTVQRSAPKVAQATSAFSAWGPRDKIT